MHGGPGCSDMSLLPQLSALPGAELESLIIGDMAPKDANGGNMKKLKFYVCQGCGNIITAEAEAYMVLYAAWAVLSAVLAKKEPYGPFLIYCLSIISSSSPGLTEPSLSTFTNMPSRGMTQSPAALRMAQS